MSICFVCSRAFSKEKKMWRHVTRVHMSEHAPHPPGKPLPSKPKNVCPHCSLKLSSRSHLNRHMRSQHTNIHRFWCKFCDYKTFKSEKSLAVHMSREHSLHLSGEPINKKDVMCGLCSQRFGIKEELNRHLHYCLRQQSLKEQKKMAKEFEALVKVKSEHFDVKDIVLIHHQKGEIDTQTATTSKPNRGRPIKDKSCPFCDLKCASVSSRNRHIARMHPDQVETARKMPQKYINKGDVTHLAYACLDCGKRLANVTSLKIHKQRIHELKADCVCDTCGKGYPIPSELRKHIKRAHGKENPTPQLIFTTSPNVKKEVVELSIK